MSSFSTAAYRTIAGYTEGLPLWISRSPNHETNQRRWQRYSYMAELVQDADRNEYQSEEDD